MMAHRWDDWFPRALKQSRSSCVCIAGWKEVGPTSYTRGVCFLNLALHRVIGCFFCFFFVFFVLFFFQKMFFPHLERDFCLFLFLFFVFVLIAPRQKPACSRM